MQNITNLGYHSCSTIYPTRIIGVQITELQLKQPNPVQILLDIHAECRNIHLLIASWCQLFVNIHIIKFLVSQIFIALLELKLQYSYIYSCVVSALRAKERSGFHSCVTG